MSFIQKTNMPGIIFSLILGISFYVLAPFISLFNAVILGLLGGILIGNLVKLPSQIDSGIKYTGSKFLEFSILFLAFDINIANIQEVGLISFFVVLLVVVFVLGITLYLSKKVQCPGTAGYLVGFGTAICGSSAIAALAPTVSKNKEDVGISLAVVNLMGTIGMLLLPLILSFIEFSSTQSGLVIGASLHSVGNVAGAGYGMGEEVGKTAITIKLARVAMLPLAVILYSFILKRGENLTLRQHLKLPYYLWGFIFISLLVSFINLPSSISDSMELIGKIVLTIAMTAIGLKVGFKSLFYSGKKAVMFGGLVFVLQLILVFLLAFLFL
jgi:uncharacterized integral membrane protein (TIGR00698 family)